MIASDVERTWEVLRGSRRDTAEMAREFIDRVDAEVAWIGDGSGRPDDATEVSPGHADEVLGRSFRVVVLDFHEDFDPDTLGRAHGLVRGGGALLFRLPPDGEEPDRLREGLAAHPYEPSDVGIRLWRRFVRLLEQTAPPRSRPGVEIAPEFEGTDEQAEVVNRLRDELQSPDRATVALVADRGRGKSSALGLALRPQIDSSEPLEVAVSARHPRSTRELFRFATDSEAVPTEGPIYFLPPADLLKGGHSFDAVVVDEAAQVPVPVLQRIVRRHRDADMVFATTTHGYEGTGRGFTVRFLEWLRDGPRELTTFELDEPIRWARDDALESLVFDTLLLDADPVRIEPHRVAPAEELEHVELEAEKLARDDRLLRQVFGLLVRAHYRTRPSDLQKLLDAPNLAVHALMDGENVVAATWAAREGQLPPNVREEIFRGHRRILGHALPEIMASRLGRREAGELEMVRSVRTAVHPDLQRRGLGTRLIEDVHRAYEPDLFGTVFSASPGVVDFRRQIGHEIVHLGTSRGRRSGQPSVTMIRPASERGRELYRELRRAYARRLPLQLELAEAGATVPMSPELRDRLTADLPAAPPEPTGQLDRHVAHYAFGPRTHESAGYAVEQFVRAHRDALDDLDPSTRALIETRVLERRGWDETAAAADADTIRAAMRGLRRAFRNLVERVRPNLDLDELDSE